jgi:hypothetical protein
MSDFVKEWFSWFEKGIELIDQEERERIFRVCGSRCAEKGVIKVYKDIYDNSCNDLNTFFSELIMNSKFVGGKAISPSKIYEITFPDCFCDLYKQGYIQTEVICECSRQSLLYILKTLNPEHEYEVEVITTVLRGDKECRFRITII